MAHGLRILASLAVAGVSVAAHAQSVEEPAPLEAQRGADSLERGEPDEDDLGHTRPVEIHGGYVSETTTAWSGARGTRYVQEVALGARFDLDRLVGIPGSVRVTVTDRRGRSLTTERIGNLVPVQTVVGPSEGTRLTEASWTIPLAGPQTGPSASVKVGRLFGQADFNASPRYDGDQLYCSFLSNGICGRPIAVPQNAGFTSYPVSVWAIRLRGEVARRVTLSAGAYEVNPRLRAAHNGFDLSIRGATGVFLPTEVTIRTGDPGGRRGQIRVGGYFDTSRAADAVTRLAPRYLGEAPLSAEIAALPDHQGRHGAYLLTDFRLQRDRAGQPQGAIVIANVQWGDARTATFTWTGFAGLVRRGTFAARDHDSIAIGASINRVNYRLSPRLGREGVAGPGSETVIEASYGIAIADGVGTRLGLQYVIAPMGLAQRCNVLVSGVRIGIDL